MMKKVLVSIAVKYDRIREGVRSVMGGKVLEYESKTIYREGLNDGRKEGIEQGIEQGKLLATERIAVKLYNTGTPIEQIAEVTGASINLIRQWIATHTA